MKDNNGWIKLYRKIQHHWLWEEKPFDKRSAWIDILLTVNHKPKKINLGNELIEIEKGECVTSQIKLSDKWGWSRTKVRNFLELLESDNMIKKQVINNKRTHLKVLNYSDYQVSGNRKKTGKKQAKNRSSTGGKQQKNTNKNVKNDKECKELNKKRSDSNSSPNPPSEPPKFDEDSMPYKAAAHLRKRILENNPRQPVPEANPRDLEDWAIELDRLNRLGPVGAKNKGYSWQEIGEIMEWCQDHHFWKSNILSAGKFREQITKLENQMNRDDSHKKSDKRAKQNEAMQNLYQKYAEEEQQNEKN